MRQQNTNFYRELIDIEQGFLDKFYQNKYQSSIYRYLI